MEIEYKPRMYVSRFRFARKKIHFIDKELVSVDIRHRWEFKSPAFSDEEALKNYIRQRSFAQQGRKHYICTLLRGTIAQLVEQRIENPRVPGSNPGSTTFHRQAQCLPMLFPVLPDSEARGLY